MTTAIGITEIIAAVRVGSIRRSLGTDGPVWEVRVAPGLLGFALVNDHGIEILDSLYARGRIVLDTPRGPTPDMPICGVRHAMKHDRHHVEALRLARAGRLHTVEGNHFYVGWDSVELASADLDAAAGDLIEIGYLVNTTRPGPTGTTNIDVRMSGLAAFKEWTA